MLSGFEYAQRYRLIAVLAGVEFAIALLLRLVLVAVYHDAAARAALLEIVVAGSAFDALTIVTAALPFVFLVSVFRMRRMRGWTRRVVVAVIAFALSFDAFVQFFFFDEYSARYNHLALDYLMYPDEVFGNILASYNVPLYAGLAAAVAAALTWAVTRRAVADPPLSWRDRVFGAALSMMMALVLWFAWSTVPSAISADRLTNEFALNGWSELVRAYLTAELDYDAYYALLPPDQAAARTARLIEQPDPQRGLIRHFPARVHPSSARDVIVVIEESLGSVFSQRFGGNNADPVTPYLDRWSREAVALTSVVANGNRTVRGLEGVLCSFVPLPPDAIIKRRQSDGVASIAAVLASHGYETTFFYGGVGLFDNMKSFMLGSGYERFVEQPDFPSDAFRTVWGVADEYVFDEMIRQQQAARRSGRAWFGTAMTVSNHKPFDVPPNRVPWDDRSRRRSAMLYADWALNRYLTKLRELGFLDTSVVLVVGDHGSRIYGVEEIPVASYHVPAMILSPDPQLRGVTVNRLVSQVDLAPTLLSVAGIEYDAPFFGRDVIGLPDAGGRAFVNHNRSIGMVTDQAMAVLQLHQGLSYYSRPDRSPDHFAPAQETPALLELARDAEAMFQTAERAYRDRHYVLPASPD